MTKQPASPTPISAEEFAHVRATLAAKRGPGTTRLSPEVKALLALKPGEGMKMPCRWKHSGSHGRNQCNGANGFRLAGRRAGRKVLASCLEGVVYVWRSAESGHASTHGGFE